MRSSLPPGGADTISALLQGGNCHDIPWLVWLLGLARSLLAHDLDQLKKIMGVE